VKAMPYCLVLFLSTAAPAAAQDWIIFGQPEEWNGMLTASEILLKNHSHSRLEFYLSSGSEGWTEFTIGSGDSALIKRAEITVAISTSRSDFDPEADAPPDQSPSDAVAGSAPGAPVDHGVYTFAHFTGGQRAEFCWNKARARWLVVAEDLSGC
jgi:hypothetical protein